MRQVGEAYRRARVANIYLVHGTFVGPDALGILSKLSRLHPAAGRFFSRINKSLVDRLASDAGNYTDRYARLFESAINAGQASPRIAVKRFNWSSQNNHIARADAAVRLLDELSGLDADHGERAMLWGHSHAGNVFALATNLLAADADSRDAFFEAVGVYYRWPITRWVDIPVWERVRKLLSGPREGRLAPPLDIATFGTPIRYGWDTDGYAKLLHFVNHHPSPELPPHRTSFPPDPQRVLEAADGDYVQHMGIAGTNLMPTWFSWRSWLADDRLAELLEPGIRRRDLVKRLAAGARVPHEGTTLLVDYGPPNCDIAHHLAGHAVYTRSERLLFHAEEVARRFYGAGTLRPNVLAGRPQSNEDAVKR
jgi:hypothetical protein